MRFLTGPEIRTEVQRISRRPGKLRAAVAYWGDGAAGRAGLSERENPEQVRIICDLLSGACNPREITALRRRGIRVKTLDRLHAKVWINGNEIILGSANASRNGLPVTDEDARQANIEAAFLSGDPNLSRKVTKWFKNQWRLASEIDDDRLAQAEELWERRRHSPGRAFTPTLLQKIRNPDSSDQFFRLRLVAYPIGDFSDEVKDFFRDRGARHYSDEQLRNFGDDLPCYQWPQEGPEWTVPSGAVCMDFSCEPEGEEFSFNGFWQVRDYPTVPLTNCRLTLLRQLPHFEGYSLFSKDEKKIARRIRKHVAQREPEVDERGFYVDMDFLEFWDADRPALKRQLIDRVVDAARELCRTGRFDSSLTLQAVRMCKDDPEWLSGYTRFVGGGIYEHGNHLKQKINREIGRRVRAAVGAEVVTDGNGRSAKVNVAGEIIQSYTPFASYDPAAVAER